MMAPVSLKEAASVAMEMYSSLMKLDTPLEREELDPLVEYIRALDDKLVANVVKRLVVDKETLRKKYNTNVETSVERNKKEVTNTSDNMRVFRNEKKVREYPLLLLEFITPHPQTHTLHLLYMKHK